MRLVEELATIAWVNPTLTPGVAGEQRASEGCAEFLRANGVAAELVMAAFAKRPGVVISRSFFARFPRMREK
ncbi:MAG: hypothetical protein ACYC92_01105 [Candidatus Acidiferrales bacterium]